MIDQDIDPRLEQHLRSVLADVAQRYEASPAVIPEEPRSGRVLRFAAAAIVVLGLAGLGLVAARRASEPAGRNDTPPAPTEPYTASAQPSDRLLYPTAPAGTEAPELTIIALPNGQRAMVQAPDGALYRVSASKQGGYAPDPNADFREIGGHQVTANSDDHSVGYSWADGCVVASVGATNDGPMWGSEPLDLLASFTMVSGVVSLDLPDGWRLIDYGASAPLVQLGYDVEIDGVDRRVLLAQSLGASIAELGSPEGQMEPVTLADGAPAWFEPESAPFPRLSFSRNGAAVWLWGADLTVDDLIAAAASLAPAPAAWDKLLTNDASVAPTGTTPPGGQPDLCGNPRLTVTP